MPQYIYEHPDWPEFYWNNDKLGPILAELRFQQGLLLGRMSTLGFDVKAETSLDMLTADIVKSSAIEGENLDKKQVRSSIARHMGLADGGVAPANRDVEGIVEMMLDATQRYFEPLTAERLFNWHSALFPTGRTGLRFITVGAWRTVEAGPMQVVSGYLGRERVHYEAPDAKCLADEMHTFLTWFNRVENIDPILQAGIAHFWFVTIHPFEDGNGRIARAIADLCLARADHLPQRFYSMSTAIARERKTYYKILESSQKNGLDMTEWLGWFLSCLASAIAHADTLLNHIWYKAKIWEKLKQYTINERQRVVINRLLDNYQGHLTTIKYAKMNKCSQDTALRDIRLLIEYGIIIQNPSQGRSSSYRLIDL